MIDLAIAFWPNVGSGYWFCFVERDLNPIRKRLITPLTFVLLLHQRIYFVMSVITISDKV